MTAYCPECLAVEVPPRAREGRCAWCRPSRRLTRRETAQQRPRPKTPREREWDLAMARIITDRPTHRED